MKSRTWTCVTAASNTKLIQENATALNIIYLFKFHLVRHQSYIKPFNWPGWAVRCVRPLRSGSSGMARKTGLWPRHRTHCDRSSWCPGSSVCTGGMSCPKAPTWNNLLKPECSAGRGGRADVTYILLVPDLILAAVCYVVQVFFCDLIHWPHVVLALPDTAAFPPCLILAGACFVHLSNHNQQTQSWTDRSLWCSQSGVDAKFETSNTKCGSKALPVVHHAYPGEMTGTKSPGFPSFTYVLHMHVVLSALCQVWSFARYTSTSLLMSTVLGLLQGSGSLFSSTAKFSGGRALRDGFLLSEPISGSNLRFRDAAFPGALFFFSCIRKTIGSAFILRLLLWNICIHWLAKSRLLCVGVKNAKLCHSCLTGCDAVRALLWVPVLGGWVTTDI